MTQERTRRLAAVWFADIVGFTDLTSTDEEAALQVVEELQRISTESVESVGGRVVKFVGDGVLAVFDSTDAALKAALALNAEFASLSLSRSHKCGLRIGVHLGEIVTADDGDVFGDGVNVAARLQGLATAGQIVLSEDVFRQVQNRSEFDPVPLGSKTLRGVRGNIMAYALGDVTGLEHGEESRVAARRWAGARAIPVGLGIALVAFLSLMVFVASRMQDAPSAGSARFSLAVGPAVSLTDDDQTDLFAAGVREDFLSQISRIRGLRTIPIEAYKRGLPGMRVLVPDDADGVMVLTVRVSEQSVILTVKLIEGAMSEQVWSVRQEMTRVFDDLRIQALLARTLADSIGVIVERGGGKVLEGDPQS